MRYRHVAGTTAEVAPPAEQDFWVAQATGPGTQELTWTPDTGRWSAAFLNASGEPGVAMNVQAAVRSGALLGIAIALVVAGIVLAVIGTILVVHAVSNRPPTSGAGYGGSSMPLAGPAPPRRRLVTTA